MGHGARLAGRRGERDVCERGVAAASLRRRVGNDIVMFSVSDDHTSGAYRAITQAGRGDNVIMTGFGGSDVSIKGLRENPAWIAEASRARRGAARRRQSA